MAGPNGIPTAIDLSNSGLFKLAFLDNSGNKNYVPSLLDNNIAKPALGELAFKVNESQSTKILQFTDRRFFITNGNVTVSQANDTAAQVAVATSSLLKPTQETVMGTNTPVAQTSPTNESTSVLYWGYWKKDGEVEFVVGATAAGTVSPTIQVSSGVNLIGLTEAAPKPIVQSIIPAAGIGSGVTQTGTTTGNNQSGQLTGSALISALSAQIEGFVATGWADQTIITYFLTPGKPGYLQYPGLTKAQFVEAADGILSDTSLATLK